MRQFSYSLFLCTLVAGCSSGTFHSVDHKTTDANGAKENNSNASPKITTSPSSTPIDATIQSQPSTTLEASIANSNSQVLKGEMSQGSSVTLNSQIQQWSCASVGGKEVNGVCWFLSPPLQDMASDGCVSVCQGKKLIYDDRTANAADSQSTCQGVLGALDQVWSPQGLFCTVMCAKEPKQQVPVVAQCPDVSGTVRSFGMGNKIPCGCKAP